MERRSHDAAMVAPLDAYSLWQHVRSAVTSAPYPRRVAYTIAVSGLDGQMPVVDHYRGNCDPTDGVIRTFPISDEQVAKPPPVPHGFNVSFVLAICFGPCAGIAIPVGHPAPYQDLLGEPLIAPTYMFGMAYETAPQEIEPEQHAPLRVIATVSSRAPEYAVTLLDTPTVDGVPTYHLKMTPLRRPKENRLRELWIGSTDYLPRRAEIAGNFTLAPLVDVPWQVDFSVIDGAPYVVRESTTDTLYLPHRRVVHDPVIAFENIREQDGIYDTPLIQPAVTDSSLIEPRAP